MVDDRFRNSFAQVFRIRITAGIGERQHYQGIYGLGISAVAMWVPDFYSGIRLSSTSIHKSNRRQQPISPLWDGLNDRGFPRVIFKRAPQFRNRARQNVIANERVGPYRLEQFFLEDRLTRVLGQADQHLHHLRLEVNCRAVACDGVKAGLYQPGSYSEVQVHDLLRRTKWLDYIPLVQGG